MLEEYGFFGTDSHFVQMPDRLNTEYQGITGAWPETISNDLPVSAEPSSLTSPHGLLTSPNVDGVLHVSPDAALHGQTFDTSAVDSVLEDGILDESSKDLDLAGVVDDIRPTSGSVKGGYGFYLSLTEPLSEDVSSGMAEFEGVATVLVHKLNPFTLSGSVPSSNQSRDVPVRVVTQTGQCLGMTHFQYVDEMHDMARQVIHDPAKQALWSAILLEEYGFLGFDSDLAQVLDPLDMQCQGRSEEKSSDDSSENNSDTDYFADVETSSIDSLGYQTLSRSTSEDNISKLYSKEQMKASTHQSISSIGKGAFARNGVMLKTGQIREGVQRKSFVLILRDSHFDSSLPEVVKGLDYTLAFHLAMSSTSIPRQMHTANESFLALRGSGKAQPTISFCKLHPSLDVLLEGSLVKNNNDHISRAVATKQHCCNQLNEGILAELRTQIPVEKAIAVDWKSSDISVKQSGAHALRELWVFTSAFRPTRKTLFVYFADRRDALPPSYFFEDEDCESQIRCWRWKGSGNNSFKFTETLKAGKLLPGGGKLQMESHADPPVTYIVRDGMMHHCWTTESTEKASNITIFDRFLGPLGTDLMMSSGSRNDDSKKRKLNICQPAVSSGEGNTKINREKCGMVESVFIDQTDCKIKGNEAKETKIQADSSKTETTLSFPSFAMEISKITSVPLTNCKIQQEFVWPACKMSHLELAEGGSCRPYGTAVRDALPFPIREDLTCFPVQEAPILPSGDQPDEPNFVSSLGNAEKPTVHRCSIEEIKQWKQQLRRPLGTDLMMSSGSRNDDGNKKKLNICQPVVSSGVGNTKINHEKWGMVEPVFIDQTDCKIKGNEAKETKVEADSSKTERRIDAGKTWPGITVDDSYIRSLGEIKEMMVYRLTLSELMKRPVSKFYRTEDKAHVSKAKTSKENFAKCTRDASFLGDWTDSTIKVNIGEETKVQADSSNTQRGSPASALRSKPLKARKKKKGKRKRHRKGVGSLDDYQARPFAGTLICNGRNWPCGVLSHLIPANAVKCRSDLANGFTMTEREDVGNSTESILVAVTATYQNSSLSHTEANAAADSIYSGDGDVWQVTEQSQLMGTGTNQANGLSDAGVEGGAVQSTRSRQSNPASVAIGGPNNGFCQSGSAERGGATSDRRLADMTVEQASRRYYPVMGFGDHVSHNGHAASENAYRVVYSIEGTRQINGLSGSHDEEPVDEEVNGLSVYRVQRAQHASDRSYFGTITISLLGEALPYLNPECVTCFLVQEQGRRLIAMPCFQSVSHVTTHCSVSISNSGRRAFCHHQLKNVDGPPYLISSAGNTERATEYTCTNEEIRNCKQKLTRSNPQTAILKRGIEGGTFFIMEIGEVTQHRRYETPILSSAMYSDRFERLMGIRIYPNGVGSGRGSHVAICTFDDLVDWPYAATITVSVLDRSGSRARSDISRIIQAKPNLFAFQQLHETICRTGYGYEKFFPIEKFFGPRHVKDAKLLLEIEFSE